jgi:RNA polymerase sigma factor (sigma-70 family)
MKSRNKIPLASPDGQPLPERIQQVLHDLLPKFNRWFPMIRDEAVVTGVFERAGAHIVEKERAAGPIARLHGFAWTVLRNLMISDLRTPRMKVEMGWIGSKEGELLMTRMKTGQGDPLAIEQRLAIDQALQLVTEQDRRVIVLKMANFTSHEIARELNISKEAVDQAYFRAKRRLGKLLGREGTAQ